MADVKQLVSLMKELEDQLVVCMRCGMCQSVCPLFEQTGRESDVARGKLALLDGLMHEMFDDPKGVFDRLNRCLLCGSCAAGCPSGVSVLEIFMKARVILAGYMGLPPAKKLVLRGMVARPELFDWMAGWGALRVGFFVGCLMDKIFPEMASAAIAVLQHHEVGIRLPENQACCGIPAVSSGDMTAFESLLAHNLARFNPEDFDYLVTACATCTSTIHEVWPMMSAHLGGNLKSRAEAVARKTIDINAFLVRHLNVAASAAPSDPPAHTVTYHDPCHLKKGLKVFREPRTLIQANPDYRLKEMDAPDWCCGMGGSFNLQYYAESSRIGKLKRDQIVRTGCDTLATGCPACMLQISDMLSQAGDRIAVKHPVQIYAESLGLAG